MAAGALAAVVGAAAGAPRAALPSSTVASPGWVADGPVYALARAGGQTYLGGDFAHMGLRSGYGQALPAAGAGAFEPGAALPEVAGGSGPSAGIQAVVSDGAGGWYVGGEFAYVNGVAQSRIAHIRPDGSLDPDFDPQPNGTVRALALAPDGGALYAGGDFTQVSGVARGHAAALATAAGMDGSTPVGVGDPLRWNPRADATVRALAVRTVNLDVTVGGTTTERPTQLVFAGGDFTQIGRQQPDTDTTPKQLGAVWGYGALDKDGASSAADALVAWRPNPGGSVLALAVGPAVDTTDSASPPTKFTTMAVYAGGQSISLHGSTGVGAAQFQLTRNGGSEGNVSDSGFGFSWTPNATCSGPGPCAPVVRALALAPGGSTLYVGGDFDHIGQQSTQPARDRIAALAAIPDPNASSVPPANARDWDPGADAPVRALALSGDGATLYAAGDFAHIGTGAPARERLAALDADADAATPGAQATGWNPGAVGGDGFALAAAGTEVYAGGDFTALGSVARNELAALDTNGQLTSWAPSVGCAPAPCLAEVRALTAIGSTVYAGGSFQSVTGTARANLAALDGGDGHVLAGFAPDPDGAVLALSPTAGALYAGGGFTHAGGAARTRVAALAPDTGTATAWDPGADGDVHALQASCDVVYVGGGFTHAGGQPRGALAAIDPATGLATAWDPEADSAVYALAVAQSAGTVYAGGIFTFAGGVIRRRIAALSASTGEALAWNPGADEYGPVRALGVSADGALVYAGGDFTAIGNGYPDRQRIAAIDAATGDAAAWNPGATETVNALAVSGDNLYAGGAFRQTAGRMQQGFAAFRGGADADPAVPDCSATTPPVVPPPGGGTGSPGSGSPGSGPGSRGGTPPGGADRTAPAISSFALTRTRFRVGGRPTPLVARRGARRAGGGTTFRYGLSEAATVTIAIERRKAGRCGRARRRCVRYVRAGSLVRRAPLGLSTTAFTGRLGSRALAKGSYRATISAIDPAGNRSKVRRAAFRVVGGR